MAISSLSFYGKSKSKPSRYIISESKSDRVKMISRKNKKKYDLKTGKINKGGKLPKVNKKTKKDCINDVYKTNKTIEYCPLCMIKLTPTQFTIHLISLIMKTICVCGVAIEIKICRN